MATNGSENSVSIRDERGRYLKGIAGGPGRPPGSRNRLTEDFLGDLHAAWQEHGREAIDRVVARRPEVFLTIVARTIDVRRVEIGQPGEFSRLPNKQAILEKLEAESWPTSPQIVREVHPRRGEAASEAGTSLHCKAWPDPHQNLAPRSPSR